MRRRHVHGDPGSGIEFTIRLDGVFDLGAARRVAQSLLGGDPTDAYALDLSRVLRFDDAAIALLARLLRRPGLPRVAVRGLRRHGLQVLCHLGPGARRALAPPP